MCCLEYTASRIYVLNVSYDFFFVWFMYTYFKRQLNIDGSMVSQEKINNLTHTKLLFPNS